MASSVEVVEKAIRFESPDWLPLELVDVPLIYDAYATLDPGSVIIPAGAESFDSIWATYHWTFEELGKNERGEILRRDEWGCVQRIPHEQTSAYAVESYPLQDARELSEYTFPDPSITDSFFDRIRKLTQEHYPNKFLCGYIDPGPFLIAFNLLSYEGLLLRLAEEPSFARELISKIFDYQKELVLRWQRAGANMINLIDEFAGTEGMMFSPELWRREFKSLFEDFFDFIRSRGLFTGILLDGNIECIFPDLLDMRIDVIQFAQPLNIGLEKIAEWFAGRRCVKASVDMMGTLATGRPADVRSEARKLVELFHSNRGGLIAVALRWHRASYPEANVLACIEAFNEFRKRDEF